MTGNSGIGKSWFLMYLLFRYSQLGEKRQIVYECRSRERGWLFRDDGTALEFGREWPYAVESALNDPRTIYLYNPRYGDHGPISREGMHTISTP